jgi:DMSO/TMAO reductase YedYZ molybdopterin-dependent catalytic subunit
VSLVSRGFTGSPRDRGEAAGLPPGQYRVRDFPVLSAGPTPHTPLARWTLSITGEVDEPRPWTWEEFRALPSVTLTSDIHCVTERMDNMRERDGG